MASLGEQFSSFETITPDEDLWLHGIDKATNKDHKIDKEALSDYVISQIPPTDDFHDYTQYNSATLPNDGLLAFEKGDQSGYGAISVLDLKKTIFNYCNPVHCVRNFYGDSRNPSVIYGLGTWVLLGAGRVAVCAGTGTDINGYSRNYTAGSTGGEYRVTLEEEEIPFHGHNGYISPNPHSHQVFGNSGGDGGATTNDGTANSITTSNTALTVTITDQDVGGQPHENVQPYITVYRWRRTN